jgi:hypothetical protein
MRPPSLRLLAVLALGGTLGGCGKAATGTGPPGAAPAPTSASSAVVSVATKNTTRLSGRDPASIAAAVALAVYPGLTPATRPQAVVLVNERDWPASLVASALASAPLGGPLLYADGDSLPAESARALRAMRPLGAPSLEGAQVIRIATAAPVPDGYRAHDVPRVGPPGAEGTAELAGAVQRLLATAAHGPPREVIALAADARLALQMPAAALAAESGAPILTLTTTGVPASTAATLESLHRPAIYVVGAGALSRRAQADLARFGRVKSVAGSAGVGFSRRSGESLDPVKNAISVSRFADGAFGWGIHEAGHGLVFANIADPLYAPAAAPLSSHGDYGPLLLLESSALLPPPLVEYLSDIEPGYTNTVPPVREVYNHGWLLGDERSISAVAQAEVDSLLEVAPRTSAQEPSVSPPE